MKHGNRFIDRTGQVYGNLLALKYVRKDKSNNAMFLCLCLLCMGKTTVSSPNLANGHTKSCGCLRQQALLTHGHSSGHRHTATYITWKSMIQRCTNPNHKGWHSYGGATPPVHICKRWLKFENFLADMGPRPAGTTLSRYADTGDYKPSKCEWHTRAQQAAEHRKKIERKKH